MKTLLSMCENAMALRGPMPARAGFLLFWSSKVPEMSGPRKPES